MKTTALIYSVFVFLFISCKQADAAAEMNIQAISLPAKEKSDVAYDKKIDYPSPPPRKEEIIETKIIKSGDIRFQTDELDKTYNQIQAAVKKYNA
jgi:hypothetical protein